MKNSHGSITDAIVGERLDNATGCAVLRYALSGAIVRDYSFDIWLLDVKPPCLT